MGWITDLDFYILDAVSKLRCDVLTPIMKALSYAGTGGAVWIVTCLVMIAIPKTRKIGIFALIAMAVDYVSGGLILKHLVARDRPYTLHPQIDTIIKRPTSYSFPSGHTSSAVAATAAIFIQNKKLSIPFIILAVMIMFSRLYFCVHYPSDIIGGIIHGILWAAVTYITIKKFTEKKTGIPNE